MRKPAPKAAKGAAKTGASPRRRDPAAPRAAPLAEAQKILTLVEALNALEDTGAFLDRLSEAAAELAGYHVAVLSVYLPEGAMMVGGHNLTAQERAGFLEAMRHTPAESRAQKRRRIRSFAYPGTGIAYVPHDADLPKSTAFVTGRAHPAGSWHAEDRLFLFVPGTAGSAGSEIGLLSLDEPLDGHAPREDRLGPLRLAERLLALGGSLLETRVLQRRLARSEAEYRDLVQGAPVGIFRRSADAKILSVNPRMADIFGYPSPEAFLANDAAFASLLDEKELARVVRMLDAGGDVRGEEIHARRRDGTPVRVRITARRDAERGDVRGIVEDVTEARRLAEEVERAHRVEALATLASGVAHDFNNLLAGILGYAALLRGRVAPGSDLATMAKAIEESAQRAAGLTRRLLGIARHDPGRKARADVREVLSDCARIARETFDRRIEVTTEIPGDLPAAACDPGELHRAVLNMCINARDAMPEGGRLRIAAAVDPRGPATPPAGAKGPWLRIDVRDTGHGMDSTVRDRLFEPFFTTKARDRGTGLGLYMVFKFAGSYGGTVEVESRPGAGAMFRIYLPVSTAPTTVAAAPREPSPVPEPGRRILVVEDEEMLRNLAVEVLSAAGMYVETASDGEEALKRLAADGAFDLLVLDLVLPRVSGTEVLRRVRTSHPSLPVVISSGNAEEAMVDASLRTSVRKVLPKPYVPDDLLRAVQAILD